MYEKIFSLAGTSAAMRFLPVFLDVREARVALVGSGSAAANKLRLLLSAGARVRWYAADRECAENRIADRPFGGVEISAADPRRADFSGFAAVIAAAGEGVDGEIAARARSLGIPVNVVDRPDLSSFISPAIVDRGEVVVAVGTSGASPVLARRLRERIEALAPARIGDLAALMGRFRRRAAQANRDARRFWEQVVDGPIG